ncbi:MAG: hypothetical protein NTW87_19690 [Planctomycetota bacterium]|nr:hypothetical protein [Planctomycetota bacterium]
MQEKARENFDAAHDALCASRPNAAANRFYYSLYLAVIVELERGKGKSPRDYNLNERSVDDEGEWPHKTLVYRACRDADLKDPEVSLMAELHGQRVTADYKPFNADEGILGVFEPRIRNLLEGLGVLLT